MGKLIVMEGTDGSGKSTQMELLADHLLRDGVEFRRLRFPRYEEESSALIRMYLGGAFGADPADVGAYAASMFYAVDRFASYASDWKTYYNEGGVLISDRYTTSNAVHQGGKVPPEEREKFFSWLYDLEFSKMGLPKPDLVLRLDMPIELTEKLMRRREHDTNTKADIHEKNEDYLRTCRTAASEASDFYGWTTIPCSANGAIRPAGEIHGDIYRVVRKLLEGE